ncbi:hypothetical protein [Cytophaga aurantiaca]|uniref:hypothetical protein n=1 Tax=Cytophaga aurantiaca TaxID=29530 RepID=UPI000363AEF4|nr:hypothetical protein [Cytophaga aurantiaca]
MKKIFLFLTIASSSIFLNAQDLKNYIPESSTYIIKINGARINKNVNFDELRATEMYKDFLFKMLNNKTAEERAITTLFETPDETGLNIKTDMYYYTIKDITVKKPNVSKKKKNDDYDYDYDYEYDTYSTYEEPINIVAIPLLNSTKFASFIKDLWYRNKAKISKAGKGISYIQSSTSLIVWKSDKVFLCKLPYRGYKNDYTKAEIKKIVALVTTPLASNSVLNNTRLLNGLGVDADVSYAFNSNAFMQTPWLFDEINKSEYIKDTTVINAGLFTDNFSFSYASFDNGKITFTGNQFYGKKLADILNPIFNLKPSAKLASIVYQTPVTSYISYAFSFVEVQKFVDKTFNYNMDTLLIKALREQQSDVFETDTLVRAYRKEIDTIDYMVNGPDEESNPYGEENSTITDSGTVYQDNGTYDANAYAYEYNSSDAKYEHETLNWYQLDSLELRQDSLYTMIGDRKDTLAFQTYKRLGIKGDELWSIFNGEFIFLYHAMTSVEKKSKVYEMDEEYNYVEVEKSNTIPMPLYSFAATINNDSLFNKYLAIMIQKGFIQKEKNRYLVVLGDMNQYIWVDKSVCILTNDNNFNPTKHGTGSKSGYEIENFNRITTHQSGAYIEVGKILASSVQFVEDKETAEVLEILAKYFDETIYSTDFDENTNVHTKSEILFNDDKKNSINILAQMMDEIYVHFTKK